MSRPRLTACVLARCSHTGLGRLLAELRGGVADEVVVGVDETSRDDTLELARGWADVVFRFEHHGPPVRARLRPLEYATGDWVLSLDEDEGLDRALAALLPELLADGRYSHYWLPRKWLGSLDPPRYLHEAPWYPDWQLRLFRNRKSHVWHPGRVHTGFRVAGTGCREDRGAILHYEPVAVGPAEREAKLRLYRAHGSESRCEEYYRPGAGRTLRALEPGVFVAPSPSPDGGRRLREVPGVQPAAEAAAHPPWRAELAVEMPERAAPGAALLVEARARNTGTLAWLPPGGTWPALALSYHLRWRRGEVLLHDGERYPMPRVVEPGETARFLAVLAAPRPPGEYEVEWDLVSEGECWFASAGSRPVSRCLAVEAPGP